MARQHVPPLIITESGKAVALAPVRCDGGEGAFSEDIIQALVQEHPSILPIREIDPQFVDPVPICRELMTPAGPIDNFMVTPSGLPIVVECKLWRNAGARREVVGQILDYAKELARFTVSDIQREASRRLGAGPSALIDLIKAAAPETDETEFSDALTINLRRGRFLLLIVGDGIREGVESISEYLQAHVGLHFSFGLVELPIFMIPGGGKVVLPRVLAHTTSIIRTVVALPDGFALQEANALAEQDGIDSDTTALGDARQEFWSEFLRHLQLDDREQAIPNPPRQGWIGFSLPAPRGSCWLTVYRNTIRNKVGLTLSTHRNTAGDFANTAIAEDWDTVEPLLAPTGRKGMDKYGRPQIFDELFLGPLDEQANRTRAFTWLAKRTNTFINVLRPRVRSAVADYRASEGEL